MEICCSALVSPHCIYSNSDLCLCCYLLPHFNKTGNGNFMPQWWPSGIRPGGNQEPGTHRAAGFSFQESLFLHLNKGSCFSVNKRRPSQVQAERHGGRGNQKALPPECLSVPSPMLDAFITLRDSISFPHDPCYTVDETKAWNSNLCPLHGCKVLNLEGIKHPSALPLYFIAEEAEASKTICLV